MTSHPSRITSRLLGGKAWRPFPFFAPFVSIAIFTSQADTFSNRNVFFDNWPQWSYYDVAKQDADFGNHYAYMGGTRLQINNAGHLRFFMPKDKVGVDQTGGQMLSRLMAKPSYTLEYRVRFDSAGWGSYDWTQGGKLPGLGGGVVYTGGSPATAGDGFSVRLLFSHGGQLCPYVYHKDQPSPYGDTFGTYFATLADDTWHTIKIYVKLNAGTNFDGYLYIYVDGVLKFSKKNLRYRTNGCNVDMLHFTCFHGGSTAEFAPSHNQYVIFDWVKVNYGWN